MRSRGLRPIAGYELRHLQASRIRLLEVDREAPWGDTEVQRPYEVAKAVRGRKGLAEGVRVPGGCEIVS